MFDFISGKVAVLKPDNLVLLNNGIGFDIAISSSTSSKCAGREEVSVYTYVYVREDALALYGFFDRAEKELFLRLIDVSGIGPKAAMGILSGMPYERVVGAIVGGNTTLLSSIKGVGKKTAERIVLELKSKLAGSMDIAAGAGAVAGVAEPEAVTANDEADTAVSALIGLGMTKGEAVDAVGRIKDAKNLSAEEIILRALKGGK